MHNFSSHPSPALCCSSFLNNMSPFLHVYSFVVVVKKHFFFAVVVLYLMTIIKAIAEKVECNLLLSYFINITSFSWTTLFYCYCRLSSIKSIKRNLPGFICLSSFYSEEETIEAFRSKIQNGSSLCWPNVPNNNSSDQRVLLTQIISKRDAIAAIGGNTKTFYLCLRVAFDSLSI